MSNVKVKRGGGGGGGCDAIFCRAYDWYFDWQRQLRPG